MAPGAPSTVLVAGASSGIGSAVARCAAASGYPVMLLARRAGELAVVASQIRDNRGHAMVQVGDATDPAAAAAAVAHATEGGARLGALVNCVGMNLPERALSELTMDNWRRLITANLEAAFVLTKAVLPVFRRQRDGLLIHVSSRSVHHPDGSGAGYQAAKAGVAALAHATMVEEAKNGVRVSVVFPGLTDTPLVFQRPAPPSRDELARALQPADVARVVQAILDLPPRAYVADVSIYPTS